MLNLEGGEVEKGTRQEGQCQQRHSSLGVQSRGECGECGGR